MICVIYRKFHEIGRLVSHRHTISQFTSDVYKKSPKLAIFIWKYINALYKTWKNYARRCFHYSLQSATFPFHFALQQNRWLGDFTSHCSLVSTIFSIDVTRYLELMNKMDSPTGQWPLLLSPVTIAWSQPYCGSTGRYARYIRLRNGNRWKTRCNRSCKRRKTSWNYCDPVRTVTDKTSCPGTLRQVKLKSSLVIKPDEQVFYKKKLAGLYSATGHVSTCQAQCGESRLLACQKQYNRWNIARLYALQGKLFDAYRRANPTTKDGKENM